MPFLALSNERRHGQPYTQAVFHEKRSQIHWFLRWSEDNITRLFLLIIRANLLSFVYTFMACWWCLVNKLCFTKPNTSAWWAIFWDTQCYLNFFKRDFLWLYNTCIIGLYCSSIVSLTWKRWAIFHGSFQERCIVRNILWRWNKINKLRLVNLSATGAVDKYSTIPSCIISVCDKP